MLNSDTDIKYVKGVGEKRAQLFKKLGISTVKELLHFYPREYTDLSDIKTIAEALTFGDNCFVAAFVDSKPQTNYIRKGMTIFRTLVTDGTDVLHITIFNNKYLAQSLDAGKEYLFYGKVVHKLSRYEMTVQYVEKKESTGSLKPVYPQTAGLTSRTIGKVIQNALNDYEIPEDILPESILRKYKLPSLDFALKAVHCPKNMNDVEKGRRRLIFEELLILQLGMAKLKNRDRGTTPHIVKTDYTDEFLSLLPFKMTNAQKNAIYDAVRDMGLSQPMNRLLQGDVGSGKTAVSAALIYNAVKNNMQCAMMAPTSILAAQHLKTLKKFFSETDIQVELIVGSTPAKEKKQIKERVLSGETQVLVGTHALIQGDVEFRNLGFVVTDEQHRFGVNQRGELTSKGDNPHVLVMSATPIPRTLGLIIYGDLDISIIDELPPGRQKIDTFVVDESYRERIYKYISDHLDKGRQGYIVCPLVDESEMLENVTSAQDYFETLQEGPFRNYRLGLLHGKMKLKEKDAVMAAFAKGEIQLLVSTTVVEVGVDVPNAVIMLIENAERFGLSTLHQLRGRVGRGTEKSDCILVSSSKSPTAKERLSVMKKTNDGFKIADADLKMRGPGDFFGERQHGLPAVKIADMLEDMTICNQSGQAAKEIIAKDPLLQKPEHRGINKETERLFSSGLNLN